MHDIAKAITYGFIAFFSIIAAILIANLVFVYWVL